MSVLISAAIAAVLAIAAMADAQCTIDPQTAVLGNMPLNDLGPGSYKGFEGGLYPGSLNYPPPDWEAVGVGIAENQIRPLDAAGNPCPTGKIVLTAIGFTNTRLEFDEFAGNPSLFIPGLVSTDPANLNPDLVVVNALEHGTLRLLAKMGGRSGSPAKSLLN